MSDFSLQPGLFLRPTAAGAFYAIGDENPTALRRLLLTLFSQPQTPAADADRLCELTGQPEDTLLSLLFQAQSAGWLEGLPQPASAPAYAVGDEMTGLLAELSAPGKALLVDRNGLTIARSGLDADTAETLAALAADLAALQERHAERLSQLGFGTQGWGGLDAFGSSRVGAWPLFVGGQRLMLVLLGEPQLNRQAFVALTWLLVSRYHEG